MAYSTTCPLHLLNVTAGRMSAFPDDPQHFVRWLAARGLTQYNECSFVPRMIFGDYLESVLACAIADPVPGCDLRHIRDRAISCRVPAGGVHLELESGATLSGDNLILASGNAAPAPWPNLSLSVASSGRFFNLTWEPGALSPADENESVLLLGTGLTAIDAVLALRHNGHRGTVHMVSRRGLLPQVHRAYSAHPIPSAPVPSVLRLSRFLRQAASIRDNWRPAVDGVRPQTNDLWQSFSQADQRRFLRHLRPYWDVHRHRMAPEIASPIEDLRAAGQLRVHAGRVGRMELLSNQIVAPIHQRGSASIERIEVDRIINCTGPQSDLRRTSNPLLASLVHEGLLAPHALRMGAAVDQSGALLDQAGHASDALFAIGPLRLGTLIESVAIPEIRQQAHDLAALIASPLQTAFQPHERELVEA